MREAGCIITDTMNNAIAKLQPGVRQFEVIANVYRDRISGFDGEIGDYTSLCPLIQVGEGTSTPHLTWTDEPFAVCARSLRAITGKQFDLPFVGQRDVCLCCLRPAAKSQEVGTRYALSGQS